MAGYARDLARNLRRPALAALTATALAVSAFSAPALARGPDAIAEVAEPVIDAVVNISSSQTIDSKVGPMPQLPPGPPFEELFDQFFKNRRGQRGILNREHTRRRIHTLVADVISAAAGSVQSSD